MNSGATWELDAMLGALEHGVLDWKVPSGDGVLVAPPSPPSDDEFLVSLPPPRPRQVLEHEVEEKSLKDAGEQENTESKDSKASKTEDATPSAPPLQITRERTPSGAGYKSEEDGKEDEKGGGDGEEGGKGRGKRSLLREELAPRLTVTLYLPDKQRVRLRLRDRATVDDTIAEALSVAKHLEGDSSCYELRMHDADGEPDEDFPSLERTRRLRHFVAAGAGQTDYCLVALPGALSAYAREKKLAARVGGGEEAGEEGTGVLPDSWLVLAFVPKEGLSSAALALLPTADEAERRIEDVEAEKGTLCILGRPGGSLDAGVRRRASTGPAAALAGAVVPFHVRRSAASVGDVLGAAAVVLRLSTQMDRYDLCVSEGDQIRLKLSSRALPLDTSLVQVRSWGGVLLSLTRTEFADAPRRTGPITRRPNLSSTNSNDSDSPHDELVRALGGHDVGNTTTGTRASEGGDAAMGHTIVTASAFREWRVIKINQFGRRQERLMGLDLARITNRKIPDKSRWGTARTRTAERLITNIQRVLVPDNRASGAAAPNPKGRELARRQFTVEFREAGDDVSITYETARASERDEIIQKLAYILRLNNDSDKLNYVPLRPRP